MAETVRAIPAFVDRILVVDDCSRDETVARAAEADPRVEVIRHERNAGVGAAIVTGYKRARDLEVDVTCVMAADNQMEPADLATLVGGVASGECDYAKANRLFTGQAWQLIPRYRYLGNAVLSFFTKIASGYWHVADSQSGYTADLAGDAAPARPRPALRALRLPQRPARPPERLEPPRARLPVAADLRRGGAERHPPAQGRAHDLLAPAQGLLLADEGEVRHPRLPPARPLLPPRDEPRRRRLRPRPRRGRPPASWGTRSRWRPSSSSPCSSSRGSSSSSSPCGSTWSRTGRSPWARTPPASSSRPASASSSCTRAARKPSRWCRRRRPSTVAAAVGEKAS